MLGFRYGLHYHLDPEKNNRAVGREAEISTPTSRTQIYVIPTNEELLIARDTYRTLEGIEPV